MTSRKPRLRSLTRMKRQVSDVLLDTAGIILLSGSANLWWGAAAGLATLGLGCFFLNWKFNEDKPSGR